ncbi:MAG: PAS domain S-box protein, partial [Calditrichaeota bacterium]|nr:PAS domain S-box protein [Calditrichota bacterium]
YIDHQGKAELGFPENFPCPLKQSAPIKKKFFEAFRAARDSHKTVIFSKNVLVGDEVFICLICPIFSQSDKFQGAILGVLNVKKSLAIALKPIILDKDDYAWVLNGEGYLIYHPFHEEMLMHNIFKNRAFCFDCHSNFELERRMLKDSSGFAIKKNLKTSDQLIAFATVPLRNTKWVIAVSLPFKKIYGSIRNQFKNYLILYTLMIMTIVSGAILISRINTKHLTAKKEIEKLKIQASLTNEKAQAEFRYRLLVEQSPDPIFLCTRKKFILVNQSFETLFGYSAQEVYSSDFSIFKLIPPSNLEYFKQKAEAFIRARIRFSTINLDMQSKGGKLLQVQIAGGRFRLNNKIVYQGIVHDVTKVRQLEREQQKRKHLAMIGEMSARIAHEIKNPLASIQTGIQLLEAQVTNDEKAKKYYERLLGEIQRVDSILKGLLSYAREDYFKLKNVQISRLINRFAGLVEPTIKKNELRLQINVQDGLPPVKIDEQKMEQVLWNIFLNAVQASKAGGTILINAKRQGRNVVLQIHDQGSGIPEHILKKIFQPFFSTRTQGNGLGLAISKKIIEGLNGKLTIESKEDKGTIVTIQLPTE